MSGEGAAPGRRGEITGVWYDEASNIKRETWDRMRERLERGDPIEIPVADMRFDIAAGPDVTSLWVVTWGKDAPVPEPSSYPAVDEFGMSEEEWRWTRWEYQQEELRQRWAALRMLWGKPIRDRWNETIRGRGEEWTVWRAVKATIAIILDRRHTDAHGKSWFGMDMGHWDYRSCGCGGCSWSAMVLQLHPWCRIEIISDSD